MSTSLIEEVDMNALKLIRANSDAVFDMMNQKPGFFDGEWKVCDKKAFGTIMNSLYKAKKESSTVTYSRIKNTTSGRRFSKCSLQGISRIIRHTLAKDIYDDIDMVNAHPTFLLPLLKEIEFSHSFMEEYVKDRNVVINRLDFEGDIYNKETKQMERKRIHGKDAVKEFILTVLNGGNKTPNTTSSEMNEFIERHQIFLSAFFHDERYKRYNQRASKSCQRSGKKNSMGSALNLYLCEVEDRALGFIEEYLTEKGIAYGTLCFDGLLIYKTQLNLSEMEAMLLEKMGFEIKLVKKPMEEGLDLSRFKECMTEWTDSDLANYFVDFIKPSIKYNPYDKTHYIYNESTALWEQRSIDYIQTLMVPFFINLFSTIPNKELQDEFTIKIKKRNSLKPIYDTILPYLKENDSEFIKQFDNKKGIFPISDTNVIELRTGLVRKRVKEDYFTKTTDNRIVALSQEDRMFLRNYYAEVLSTENDQYIKALVRMFGYSLTGEANQKLMPILLGKRDCGKTSLMNTHSKAFGEFASPGNKRVFIEQKNKSCHDSELFTLKSKRLITISELKEEERFNTSDLKAYTGGSPVDIRGAGMMRTESVTFQFVPFGDMNGMASMEGDEAFHSRIVVFTFKNQFDKTNPDGIAKIKKLSEMTNEIFSLIVEEAKLFYEEGLIKTEEMVSSTESIINSQNPVKQFADATYEKDENSFICKSDVFPLYQAFCSQNRFKALGKIKFYKEFEDLMDVTTVQIKTINKPGYRSLKSKDDEEEKE